MSSAQTFLARFGETEEQITVKRESDRVYRVEVDGVVHHVDAERFAGGTWSLVIDNQSYDVELEVAGEGEADGRYNTLVRGEVVALQVVDKRRATMGVASGRFSLEGPQSVDSPMPGKVVKILVEVGQEVEENQPLVIVEAMKMENELAAPKAGKVSAITAEVGQTVEPGTKLLTVE